MFENLWFNHYNFIISPLHPQDIIIPAHKDHKNSEAQSEKIQKISNCFICQDKTKTVLNAAAKTFYVWSRDSFI